MPLLIEDPTPDPLRRPPVPRTYDLTHTNGFVESYAGITRTTIVDDVLTLYRRERPGDAEVHVASLPLVNVRKWVKSERPRDTEYLHVCHGCTGEIAVADQRSLETSAGTEYWHNDCLPVRGDLTWH
jgi:hypothetical protein